MRIRTTTMFVVAAALSLEATAASAQARTRSTTRIPVTKEAPGEVVPPRVDTVTIYRTDTLRIVRTDTVTRTRVDTVRIEPPPPPVIIPQVLRKIGGFYFGLAAGGAVTTGDLDNGQSGGFHLDVPFGWDAIASPLGIRFDAGYTWLNSRTEFENIANDPQIFTFGTDLKLRLPVTMPYTSRFQFYAVGGGTYSAFKDIVEIGDGAISVGDVTAVRGPNGALLVINDNSWQSKWGWNAGGGLQFGWGKTNVFVESRIISFNNRIQLNQVPIVLGISWF